MGVLKATDHAYCSITEEEYRDHIVYAKLVLEREYNRVIVGKYTAKDALQDALLSLMERGTGDIRKEVRLVIGRFKRAYIKQNPRIYQYYLEKDKAYKSQLRRNLSSTYLKSELKRRGIPANKENLEKAKISIQAHRNGLSKVERLKAIPLPALWEGCILIHQLPGYEDYYGYMVDLNSGQVYSCRNTMTKWTTRKAGQYGAVRLVIGKLEKRFYPNHHKASRIAAASSEARGDTA